MTIFLQNGWSYNLKKDSFLQRNTVSFQKHALNSKLCQDTNRTECHQMRWLQVLKERHSDEIFKTPRMLIRELRENTGKQSNSLLDLIILKRETLEWISSSNREWGREMIYFFRLEKRDEEMPHRALSAPKVRVLQPPPVTPVLQAWTP